MVEATSVASPEESDHRVLDEDGKLRSDTYAILASLLSHTPSEDLIDYLKHIQTPTSSSDSDAGNTEDSIVLGGMGQGWQKVRNAALAADPSKLDDEYHDLFIGLGRGEVVPFGSWHITGFLMEKPLSELRDDLKSLGIESDQDVKDPEDHIAALFESMKLIIESEDIDESRERQFFMRHIAPWAEKFFQQLQVAKTAEFYKSVGFLGEQFVQLESQYLNIQTH